MYLKDVFGIFSGIIEVDETYLANQRKNKNKETTKTGIVANVPDFNNDLIFCQKKAKIKIDMGENPQVIFSWRAPLRPYKKRSALIIRFYLAVALLLSIIVFFFGDKILIVPIWAVLFLFYVLTITPPPEVENKITVFGVEVAGTTVRWETLSYFYFSKRFGFDTLTIVGHPPFFYHLYLVVTNEDVKNKLIQLLSKHLIFKEKPPKTITDKLSDWFCNLLPDEEEHPSIPPTAVSKPQPATP